MAIDIKLVFIFLFVSFYYIGVVFSIIHLVLKTRFTLKQQLRWTIVLWVPLVGLPLYWLYWVRHPNSE